MDWIRNFELIFAVIGSLYAGYLIISKPVFLIFGKMNYLYNSGVPLVKNIEKEFGKEPGMVIKALIQSQSKDFKTADLRLQKIESHAGLGIYACEADGKCKFANPALAELFEMDRIEMEGYGWLKNVVDKETVYDNWQFCVKAGIPYSDTYEIHTQSGSKKIFTEATPTFEHDILIGYVGIAKQVNSKS